MSANNITSREQQKLNLENDKIRVLDLISNAVSNINVQHVISSTNPYGIITFDQHKPEFNGIEFSQMNYLSIKSTSFNPTNIILQNNSQATLDIEKLWLKYCNKSKQSVQIDLPFCILSINKRYVTYYRDNNKFIDDAFENFKINNLNNNDERFRTKIIKIHNQTHIWVVIFLDTSEEGEFYFSKHEEVEDEKFSYCINTTNNLTTTKHSDKKNVSSSNDLSNLLFESKLHDVQEDTQKLGQLIQKQHGLLAGEVAEVLSKISEDLSIVSNNTNQINDIINSNLKPKLDVIKSSIHTSNIIGCFIICTVVGMSSILFYKLK